MIVIVVPYSWEKQLINFVVHLNFFFFLYIFLCKALFFYNFLEDLST